MKSNETNLGVSDVGRTIAVFRLTVWFIAMVIATFVAVEGWRAWRDYDQAYSRANDSVINLARATAQHAEDAIRQVDVLTDALSERVEGDGLDHLNVARIHALLVQQAKLMPQLHGLFIYGADGQWLVTDKPVTPESANNADRDYFIYHRTHKDRQVRIGAVVRSRSTDELIIPVSRRLNNPDGSFAGVLLGTIKVSYFVDYYGDFKIDDRGALVLAMRNGRILVRRPFTPGITEQSLANGEIFRRYLPSSNAGVAQGKAVIDGTERLYGYRVLSSYPLFVEAGLSRESFVGPWRTDLIKTSMFLLILVAGLVGFGFVLLKQLRQRMIMENELRQAHRTLHEMALTDSLTGLGNRRRLDIELAEEIIQARRQGYPVALLMVDVDDFKRFNDRYGHAMGDDCLRRIGEAIKQTLTGPNERAVRYGGEEFAVLAPNHGSQEANQLAERILAAVRGLAIPHAEPPAGIVTASAGVAVSVPTSDPVTPDGLIKSADTFLYTAKSQGRNRWYSAIGNSSLESLFGSANAP